MAGETAMSQIQKMTAHATEMTAAITISLTRQRRFGFFGAFCVVEVRFCDIGDPSFVGRGMPLPSVWARAPRRSDFLHRY